jgi:general secretion pathway protein N
MSWQRLRWWLLGAAAYAVFLGATLPAQFMVDRVGKHLPGLRLSGVTGSIFSGSAADVRYQGMGLGAAEWHFDWLAPFTLSLGYRIALHTDQQYLNTRIDVGYKRIHLRGIDGRLPLGALEHWLPLPPHSVDGFLTLHLAGLDLKEGQMVSAEGEVDLDDATLRWPAAATLGSFRAELSPAAGGGIQAAVEDVASPLKLHADLSLTSQGAYHLKGILAAKDSGDQATRALLANLGTPDSTGQYPFDFNGQW